jgi:TonB family protein
MLNPHVNRRPASRWLLIAVAGLLLAIALPVAAAIQATPPAPSGRIADPSGRPLPDATVLLTSLTTEATYETRSDAAGLFRFADVPPGEYLMSARYPGFSSARNRVRIDGAVNFALQLQLGTLQETITVRGGGPAAPPNQPRPVTKAMVPVKPACGNTEVGGNVKPPMKVRDVRPRYKAEWADQNLQGSVLMQATVGVDGKVKNVEVVSRVNAELEDEAIAAVSRWEFTPTWLNCETVEVRMFVTVNFQLER